MNETKHTELPWEIVWERDDADYDGPRRATSIGPIDAIHNHWTGWTIADEADAEFVCLAANCHDELVAACEATLLFYRAGEWNHENADAWKRLTGGEATTKVLCDTVRAILAKVKNAHE